jgi:glutamate/tyrosine decarboxylase-like PLP-dependent enzyme
MEIEHSTYLKLAELISTYVKQHRLADVAVVQFLDPKTLASTFDFNLNKTLKSEDELFKTLEDYLTYSVRTGHPQFFNQLFAGYQPLGLIAEAITAMTNTSMYTYEVAPVATLIEKTMIQKMAGLVGFKMAEGIFVTGGSNANLVAMMAARHEKAPQVLHTGLFEQKPLSLFVSEEAHYSFAKAATILGIGTDHLYKVAVDDEGKMSLPSLREKMSLSKQKGETPFFVGATAGTTVRGAFDPIVEIGNVCREENCWLHVDGAWGASVLLSKKHRKLVDGIELADSVTWDTHKLMGAPLITSVVLFNRQSILKPINNTSGTDYLFHEEENEGSFDLGQSSLQCGRKVDAFKLWLMWKTLGDHGFETRIDKLFSLQQHAVSLIKKNPLFQLTEKPSFLNICFRVEPKEIKDQKKLDELQIAIRQKLYQSGRSMVNYAKVRGQTVIRLILANFDLEEKDLHVFFTHVEQTCEEVLVEWRTTNSLLKNG